MSDFALAPRSGLEHVLVAGNHGLRGDASGVTVALRSDLALALVMARNGKVQALQQRVQERLGLTLPTTASVAEPSGSSSRGALRFIWAGPGRWLAATATQTAGALQATLCNELSGLASITDQSDGRCVFRIGGPRIREVLATGVPIDLDPRAFGPGDAALTLAGHISVHLWQLDRSPAYEVAVARSFAASFCQWLFAASAKYGLSVLPA